MVARRILQITSERLPSVRCAPAPFSVASPLGGPPEATTVTAKSHHLACATSPERCRGPRARAARGQDLGDARCQLKVSASRDRQKGRLVRDMFSPTDPVVEGCLPAARQQLASLLIIKSKL
jgi:hypothetical protein